MKTRIITSAIVLFLHICGACCKSVINQTEIYQESRNPSDIFAQANGINEFLHRNESDFEREVEKNVTESESYYDRDSEEHSYEAAGIVEDSINRVQKVLNAFFEVTGMLADVPRQLWMLPIRFGFYPGIKADGQAVATLTKASNGGPLHLAVLMGAINTFLCAIYNNFKYGHTYSGEIAKLTVAHHTRGDGGERTQDEIPELVPFPCSKNNSEKYKRADSVHRLRPQDIKVIAALGDSLTSANGAMAYTEEETRLNYRGVSAMGGGQGNWRKFLTLPNIIKEFSPKLIGYAIGVADTSSPLSGLNVAENGALDDALLQQTKEVVRRIRQDPFIDFENDWKIVNILIGGNDICNEYCYVESEKDSPQGHRRMLEASLGYLKARLPRTFVNLIHIPNILQLRNLKNIPFVCYAKKLVLCSCLFGGAEKTKAQSVEATLRGYWEEERRISELSKYDSDDFTVVLQPFFLGVPSPDNVNTIFGEAPDLSLFAPDCFHFSQRSNALIANALWNNMLEPIGNKTRGWQPIMERFLCPTDSAPYLFTRSNTKTFLETGHQ